MLPGRAWDPAWAASDGALVCGGLFYPPQRSRGARAVLASRLLLPSRRSSPVAAWLCSAKTQRARERERKGPACSRARRPGSPHGTCCARPAEAALAWVGKGLEDAWPVQGILSGCQASQSASQSAAPSLRPGPALPCPSPSLISHESFTQHAPQARPLPTALWRHSQRRSPAQSAAASRATRALAAPQCRSPAPAGGTQARGAHALAHTALRTAAGRPRPWALRAAASFLRRGEGGVICSLALVRVSLAARRAAGRSASPPASALWPAFSSSLSSLPLGAQPDSLADRRQRSGASPGGEGKRREEKGAPTHGASPGVGPALFGKARATTGCL